MGLTETFNSYLRRDTPKDRTYGQEFFGKYIDAIPLGTHSKMLQELERLVYDLVPEDRRIPPITVPSPDAEPSLIGLSETLQTLSRDIRERKLPLVVEVFYEMLGDAVKNYTGMRKDGVGVDEAFEQSVSPIDTLIQALAADEISAHPFYRRLQDRLSVN